MIPTTPEERERDYPKPIEERWRETCGAATPVPDWLDWISVIENAPSNPYENTNAGK